MEAAQPKTSKAEDGPFSGVLGLAMTSQSSSAGPGSIGSREHAALMKEAAALAAEGDNWQCEMAPKRGLGAALGLDLGLSLAFSEDLREVRDVRRGSLEEPLPAAATAAAAAAVRAPACR